jgi:hypothetical protein
MTDPVLGYATNCHAGEGAAELIAAVRDEVGAVRRLVPQGAPLNLSLRISARAAAEFDAAPELLDELRQALSFARARLVGVNAFPISAPQAGAYKDGIYRPDWRDPERLASTLAIARMAAGLIGEGGRLVLSTLAGTCRLWPGADSPGARQACAAPLQSCAEQLEMLSAETGRDLVLALEPEPCTTAETLGETLAFFREELFRGPRERLARSRLAVNLDLCHSAVMFEDAAESLRAFHREGVPVGGLHVSAALRVPRPAEHIEELRAFDEPKYLHQVAAVDGAGRLVFRSPDLGGLLALPPERLAALAEARVHYHVPVYLADFGGLATTQDLTWNAVRAARDEKLADLFVVETYTWPELPDAQGAPSSVAEGIALELARARQVLEG